MGRVERFRDRDLLRDVAVKQLRPNLLNDASMLAQFLWEARVTAYLDHPNIVPVHDLDVTSDGQLFFTMKLVRGSTLERVIDEARGAEGATRFDRTRRLRLFLSLCNAISFAHTRGVLHRDLKPANVMIGEFGEVLVTDWGLALALAGAGDALRSIVPSGLATSSAGTPMYMSPEQVRSAALDARSDVFSLGVILYELIALRPPYEATTLAEIMAKVASGDVFPLERAAADVSDSLLAVVRKAMQVEASSRYESAPALAEDVEAVLDGRTPTAETISLGRRAARYYVGRDPAMSQLRVVDIDMWAASAMLFGAVMAIFVGRWLTISPWIGWALIAGSLAVAMPSTLRWLRLRRRGLRSSS